MTGASTTDEVTEYHRWLSSVTDDTLARFGLDDRLGTANYIDTAARLRAVASIQTGEAVHLARPLVEGPGFHVETTFDPAGTFGLDRIDAECHGYAKTHMDALNHLSKDGVFYGDRQMDDEPPSIVDLAEMCVFTRAVFADIPAVRGTPWVTVDAPVTAEDIDAALDGLQVLPGDALILYMGRDRWEAAGNVLSHVEGGPDEAKPGAGRGAGRWIVEHQISLLAWDFLDAIESADAPREEKGCVHRLLPAAGLVLIDNCDMTSAAPMMSALGRRTAALAALPLSVPGGTGSLITPWLLL